jgi:hypothetical protein
MPSENIYAQFAPPLRSVQDYAAEYDQRDLNKLRLEGEQRKNMLAGLLQQQQVGDMQRKQASNNVIRDVYSKLPPGAPVESLLQGLRATGDQGAIERAAAEEKSWLERRNTESQIGERGAKTAAEQQKLSEAKRQAAILKAASFTGPDDAIAMLNQSVASGEVPMQYATLLLRSIPRDPNEFRAWQLKMVAGVADPAKMVELLKPIMQTNNTGGATVTQAIDPISGKPTVMGTIQNTQSPDNAASNARMAADAAAGRAQSAAQFNARLSYDKEKDKTAAAGGGNITEGERNAGGYAARMTEASKLLDQFEGKGRATYKTDALGGVPLVGRALQTSAMTADQQRYRQAQEDWVRAKLRKESGASIAPDEMAREISAYFPEPGDTPENIKQKKQAREVANAAMVQSAGRGAPKAAAATAPGSVLRFDAQGNPVN